LRTKIWYSTLLQCCAAFVLLAVSSGSVEVPQAQIDADNARWAALGVQVPATGIVWRHPYDGPYSGHSFIVPWSWYDDYYKAVHAKRDFPIRASDLRADLPTLRFLMQRVYAGYATAKKRGWNWNSWFSAWDRDLASRGDQRLSLHNAFAPWGKLEQFQLDNHSGVVLLQDYVSGSASAVLSTNPKGRCTSLRTHDNDYALSVDDPGQQPHRVLVWNGGRLHPAWYMSYPKRDGAAVSVVCGGERIALQPTASAATKSNRENVLFLASKPSYEHWNDGIVYIRMPTFIDANDSALEALLAKTPGVGKERVVIFDLRGNEGGNAPIQILQYWFPKIKINKPYRQKRYSSDSCFADALYFNLEEQLAAGLPFPAPQQERRILQYFVNAISLPSANDCTVKPDNSDSHPDLQNRRFSLHASGKRTRIIALVDNGCGSDCEGMTAFLANLPDTVIAGTSTFGVMGFSQPGYFVLPYSRVPFRLALTIADAYGDGRSIDGYGMSVDVLLPTVQSQTKSSLLALARALR